MKKKFDWGILLLFAVYLAFGAAILVAFSPMQEQQDYPTEEKVRASFDQHFEAFDQVSRILWNHPDYFDDLYEETEVRGLLFNTKNALAAYGGDGYLTEAEWDRLKALCDLVQPYEIVMRSHGGANAVEWVFIVQESDGKPYCLNLFYIRAEDAPTPEKERDAVDEAVSYLGQFNELSPMEGKDGWYESVTSPANDWDKPMPRPPKDE